MPELSTVTSLGQSTNLYTPPYTDATVTVLSAPPIRAGVGRRRASQGSYKNSQPSLSSPELGAELRSQWVKAKRAATAIADALERDPPASFGPACDLGTALDAMWKLRKQRDDDNWTGILDRLQTTLRELGGDGVSLLTSVQGRKLEEFVVQLLSLSEKSDTDLLEAVRLMDEMGVPPFVDFQALAEANG